jgi:hypothetical protein
MKHMKSLGLLLMTALAALMMFASPASALLTSSEGEFPTISAAAEGHVVLDNPIAKIECASSFGGKVESNFLLFAAGKVSTLSFTFCTNSWHVTVVASGSFQLNTLCCGEGALTSSGATIEATRLGITCRYATNWTPIGP